MEALFDALGAGDLRQVERLIAAGCDVNAPNTLGDTPLIVAALTGSLEIVCRLIEAGADVNQVNPYAESPETYHPLFAAACQGNAAMIDYLVPKMEPALKRETLESALFQAVQDNNGKIVKTLIGNHQVNVNSCRPGVFQQQGWSVLMDAVEAQNLAVVRTLLEAGADPNYADRDEGKTPLMCAIDGFNEAILCSLVQANADVNAATYSGKTALMKASESGKVKMVEILLQAGVDVRAIDGAGMTAFWYAEKMGNTELADYLQRAVTSMDRSP